MSPKTEGFCLLLVINVLNVKISNLSCLLYSTLHTMLEMHVVCKYSSKLFNVYPHKLTS